VPALGFSFVAEELEPPLLQRMPIVRVWQGQLQQARGRQTAVVHGEDEDILHIPEAQDAACCGAGYWMDLLVLP
jgi:hypothetical protein